MFTEPSGVVLRESMDMNYNYDELWLVPALTAGGGATSTVLNGSQLSSWFDERDTTLPADALTCHHLDSHDTFWWPAPGRKWRREQIGLPATRALTWCLALSGGAFMMFTGGEAGRRMTWRGTLALRRQRDELAGGGRLLGRCVRRRGRVLRPASPRARRRACRRQPHRRGSEPRSANCGGGGELRVPASDGPRASSSARTRWPFWTYAGNESGAMTRQDFREKELLMGTQSTLVDQISETTYWDQAIRPPQIAFPEYPVPSPLEEYLFDLRGVLAIARGAEHRGGGRLQRHR